VKNRGFLVRWGLTALLLLVAGVLAGCSGGTQATNWTSLTVGDNVVYVADLEQVRALDTESGAVVWSFPAEANLREYGPFYNVTRAGDTLLVTSQERIGGGFIPQMGGVLRAIGSDGRLSWEFKGATGEYVAPGVAGDCVFVIGNGDGNVYDIDVA